MQTIKQADWLAEGKRLFGEDFWKWKFVCPVCGNVQTAEDFKALGAKPESCYHECIGRYLPKDKRRDALGRNEKDAPERPCNYAAYGLFRLGPTLVEPEDGGKPVPVFGFAKEEA